MSRSARKILLMLGAFCALAVGASALAGAAATGSATSSSSSSSRADRPPQAQLTGVTADKVKAAALAKVPGATVVRVESGGRGGSAYHAHVRKPDGTMATVLVSSRFEATSVQEAGPGGPHGPCDEPGQRGGPGARGAERAPTGETAA